MNITTFFRGSSPGLYMHLPPLAHTFTLQFIYGKQEEEMMKLEKKLGNMKSI